jgi:hypothetical protein
MKPPEPNDIKLEQLAEAVAESIEQAMEQGYSSDDSS